MYEYVYFAAMTLLLTLFIYGKKRRRIVFNKKTIIWIIIVGVLLLALILGLVFGLQGGEKASRTVGAVVSNGRGCADIGREMLEDGGSAVDAAIATLLCEGVLLPHSMGIGGGFVATIYTKATGKIETVVARESAPAKAQPHMFVGYKEITGGIAGGVPGELLGYWEMHKKYGRLPWRMLFQPTIKLCKEGHYVSKYLAAALVSKESYVRNEPSLGEIFINEHGELYKEGDYMKRERLGETLEKIAQNGVGEMYDGGEVGRMFVEDMQDLGSIITLDDLKNFKVSWEENNHAVADLAGGFKLYTTPLPSSGGLLAFILNTMRDLYTDNENVYWQRVIETYKHAYGLRTNLGDLDNEPDMAESIRETYNKLLSPDYVQEVHKLIKDDRTFENYLYYGANFTIEEDHGTANMAILAANGDAITVTSTINNYFGGKVRSTRTGIILNDEMDDFSTPGVVNSFGVPASPANYIKPGKRPMSSMCPAIVLDQHGNVRLLIGAAGGTKITTSVASAVLKYLILNESLDQAVNDGRFHHQLAPMLLEAEMTTSQKVRDYLESTVGHKIKMEGEGTGFAALTAIGRRDIDPEPFYDRRRVGSTALLQVKSRGRPAGS